MVGLASTEAAGGVSALEPPLGTTMVDRSCRLSPNNCTPMKQAALLAHAPMAVWPKMAVPTEVARMGRRGCADGGWANRGWAEGGFADGGGRGRTGAGPMGAGLLMWLRRRRLGLLGLSRR